ncbi:MAG: tetratricopeptide repeat protein [Pyrinomonadaceae bacterium]
MVADEHIDKPHRPHDGPMLSVRVHGRSYLAAVFIGSFFSALALYLELNLPGYILLGTSLVIIPALAATDRMIFNGKRVYRSGLLPRIWTRLFEGRFWLKLKDIEQVETRVLPALKRGGRVYFRYQTQIRGNGLEFSFSSGGKSYRRMVKAIFASLPEEVLDAGSIELRDYLEEPGQARRSAKRSDIPPADVLEHAFRDLKTRKRVPRQALADIGPSSAKAASLRLLGNQLRLSGSLLQAMESFRRAASIQPNDPWLLFDFARCIQAFAGTEGSGRLERKAAAMLRLAERRAGNDGRLLARLGESYFQIGDWHRAGLAFRKAVDAVGEQFRSICGMAEIALRDGKLAHVVHNFNTASRLAESPAARRWSRGEAEYFLRLNSDSEYMEMELGRVNLLDALDRWKGSVFRLCLLGFPIIGFGLYFEDAAITNAGWILSAGMLVLWTVIVLASRAFTSRIAPELLTED